MPLSLTEKIIKMHLREGNMDQGEEIGIVIDQTLTQDATGTLAYLQWEAIGLDRVQTELSVSYVDHNTLQMGFRNPDDHRYLRTVASRYGLVFSPPGTGICHQLHLENFAIPGKTLLGSDSHTPTAGGVGSLAIGAGGLSVALSMAGEPYFLPMPRIIQIWLKGSLQGWATAKDVILFLLSKLSVKGAIGAVLEYAGPGVETLSVPERATITNMGAELGATSSIFPSDHRTEQFFESMNRKEDFVSLQADPEATYSERLEVDLDNIVPMAACPHMPDKGVPVTDLDGLQVDQVAIGSCTNSSYADLKLVAQILQGKRVNPETDVLLSPGSRQVLSLLTKEGWLESILDSGARVLECACGPCIGMGGSPVSKGVSLRTFNRNFEGRSGTIDAQIYLVSPVTAAQAALSGKFTDPKTWGQSWPKPELPKELPDMSHLFIFPAQDQDQVKVQRGPNIVPLNPFLELPDQLELKVLLKVGDNITTDHILPGGAQITALRSNIPAISKFVFHKLDSEFVVRSGEAGQGMIVGGENYGQGSSREHAALAPRHLGIRVVLAKSFARIHRANLINFGIVPLFFANPKDYDLIELNDNLNLDFSQLQSKQDMKLVLTKNNREIAVGNDLTPKEIQIIKSGGMLNYVREKRQ